MCGIVGVLGAVSDELVMRVVKESTVRGLHHLGLLAHHNHKSTVCVLYHARYCTSGQDHQPIASKLNLGIAMNGVIHMGTKKEMEKYFGIKMQTDNDAEVLLQWLEHHSFEEFLKRCPQASIAGLLLTPKKLIAFRNEKRPLWLIEKGKSVLLASTQDILKRAGADWKRAKLLKPNKTYAWTI